MNRLPRLARSRTGCFRAASSRQHVVANSPTKNYCGSHRRSTGTISTTPRSSSSTGFHEIGSRRLAISHLNRRERVADYEHGGDENGAEELMDEVQEANERCFGSVQLRRDGQNQWGVFASRPFAEGSVVISSALLKDHLTDGPNPSPVSCSHSIQMDWDKHVFMDLPARFLNHSCDPTVGVGGVNESGSYDFVALRGIDAGEEVRFDYETTEYEIGAFSACSCGAAACRGSVRGYRHNSNFVRAKYGNRMADYLTRGW